MLIIDLFNIQSYFPYLRKVHNISIVLYHIEISRSLVVRIRTKFCALVPKAFIVSEPGNIFRNIFDLIYSTNNVYWFFFIRYKIWQINKLKKLLKGFSCFSIDSYDKIISMRIIVCSTRRCFFLCRYLLLLYDQNVNIIFSESRNENIVLFYSLAINLLYCTFRFCCQPIFVQL